MPVHISKPVIEIKMTQMLRTWVKPKHGEPRQASLDIAVSVYGRSMDDATEKLERYKVKRIAQMEQRLAKTGSTLTKFEWLHPIKTEECDVMYLGF